MSFFRFVMNPTARKRLGEGLRCSECGVEFEDGDVVYSHHTITQDKHLCEECYNALYIDI